MAAPALITCPSCVKRFKGKPELAGKRIKCPACGNPFVVPKEEQAPPPPKPEAKPVAQAATVPPNQEVDEDGNPYGVTFMDMSARCPNCANKMESEDAIICLHCGYNTQMRSLGVTKKLVEHTFGERLAWLSPGIAAAAGILALFIAQLYYCLCLEEKTHKSWLNFVNFESLRLWCAVILLGGIWAAGLFVLKRLILHPTPPDKEMETATQK